MSNGYRPGGAGLSFGPGLTPTITALIAANLTVFIVQFLLSPAAEFGLLRFFGLVPAEALPRLKLWQFVTYMFLHGGFWHLFFNMFGLFMFGPEIEATWGRRVFLRYYFVCGLGGGLTYTVTSWGSPVPLVGASGALFGILLAYALLFPDRRILLYFIFPIKAKWFVIAYGAMELYLGFANNAGDNVAHFAHLGGMIFGFFLIKYWNSRINRFKSWD